MVDTSSTAATVRSTAHRLQSTTKIGLTALGVAIALTVTLVMLARTGASRPTTRSQPPPTTVANANAPRTSRLDAADWAMVQNVVHVRAMALTLGRTALYRAFAAYMGLSALLSLHPVLPGPCATAVSYLYDNLLDLHNAYPREDWQPLRHLIHKQPPLSACAPKATPHVTYVG